MPISSSLGLDGAGVAILEEELVGDDEERFLPMTLPSSSRATGVEPS